MLLSSKCIAGGVSAALILLWWPLLATGGSLSAWLVRGVAFTLTFELVLLGLRPLEHALWATRAGERLRARLDGLAERVSRGDTVRRLGSSAVIAVAALAIPVMLIAAGLHEQPKGDAGQRAQAVRVVRVTKVVRPVTVRRVVAPSAPAVAAPSAALAQAAPVPTRSNPVRKSKPTAPRTVQSPTREPAAAPPPSKTPAAEPAPKAESGDEGSAGDSTTGRGIVSGSSVSPA